MKRLLLAIASLIALTMSAPANAGFTAPLTIRGIDVGDSGQLIIAFDQPLCGVPGGLNRVHVARTAPYYDSMLAMSLSAHAMRTPVQVYINACEGGYTVEAVRMSHTGLW